MFKCRRSHESVRYIMNELATLSKLARPKFIRRCEISHSASLSSVVLEW